MAHRPLSTHERLSSLASTSWDSLDAREINPPCYPHSSVPVEGLRSALLTNKKQRIVMGWTMCGRSRYQDHVSADSGKKLLLHVSKDTLIGLVGSAGVLVVVVRV